MKLLKLISIAIFLFLNQSPVAFAMDMNVEQDRTKGFLTMSGEMSQFVLEEGAIAGTGLKIDFSNSFSDWFALQINLDSAFKATGGSSFTGVGGYAYYSVFGDCCTDYRRTSVDGKPIITESTAKAQNLQIGVGIEQFFLNGAKSVYSASGLGYAALYQFSLLGYNFKAEVRSSQLTAGPSKIQGNFMSLGMVFNL